ncbi:MAG: phosphomannose isomerase type II C-terminal cupin domain [bacterium]|nr:phosphomannose isomerase type II C-terminal cupin domain [bacterium]
MQYDERPWGRWDMLDEGKGFKVKRLTVRPGHRLSLQFHRYRSENWVVAKGEAVITVSEKVINLKETEHIFIEKGAPHRLENKGREDLIVIEVQNGQCLEDDLVRIEDDYGR